MDISGPLAYLFPGISFRPGGECELQTIGGVQSIRVWRRPEPQPTPEQIAAAMLPAAKAQRIEQINAEVRRRLVEHYGDALEQVSRASGVYGETAQANHLAGVQATIAASNTAQAAVIAAESIEAVEAVSVSWPTLV